MSRLSGKVAVVTGAANGLGAAVAARMAGEGAAVAVLDISNAGAKAAQDIVNAGGTAKFFTCDVTQEAEVEGVFAEVVSRFGKLDVLVNNAGTEGLNKPTHEFPLAEWERVMAVNTTAVFLCTKHAIPYLRNAGAGSVINISSIYGLVGGADIPPYHASKGAVRLMSKNDALTYAPDNIRVNSIHPGFVVTSMVQRYVEDTGLDLAEARPALDALHPLGGTGEPDDIAWTAVFLASDQAKWITGAEIVVDGGYTAR